ncbi:MAG: nicotinate-nucleotide--dimethylbenzimidazole phosphoribosyltransferase, partial [Alphaproteobacteria bacterium]|nr:nicotinate-nucleotide--dimethylbenzimidazole phosphoribosyltransferase [Alphaproteobacteria bacterium]
LPFDDLRALFAQMPPPSAECVQVVRQRNAALAKREASLGRMEEIAEWLAAWQGRSQPAINRPLVAIFAASHGVYAHGVSTQPQALTRQMLETLAAGGSAVNQICAAHDLGLKAFDLAIDLPTGDITCEAALDEKSAAATFAFGMEAIAGGTDLLCVGDSGAGGTTAASAVAAALCGGAARDWVLRGTADEPALARKIACVEAALEAHRAHLRDPFEVMRRLGGREICATAGAIMAARMERIPVILDGFVSAAAAAILQAIDARAIDHCLAGHVTGSPAHAALLARLGKKPLLDLAFSLGEGTGAALAAGLVKTALACHTGMATREQAGVTFQAG